MWVIWPLRLARFCITAPMHSSGHFDPKRLVRLKRVAVSVLFDDDLRAGDQQFEPFAAHRLHEHGDLHGAARLQIEDAGPVGVLDRNGDVGLYLAVEAVVQLARRDKLAFAADERTVVDAELHFERRRIDLP